MSQVDDSFSVDNDELKRSIDSSDYQMSESGTTWLPCGLSLACLKSYFAINEFFLTWIYVGDSGVIDEEAAKEWEHTLLQDSMDKELHELNKRLEQKEVENCFLYLNLCLL